MPGGGHRSDAPGDSGRSGCALQLRRRGHRCVRAYRNGGLVRRRARWRAPACTARTGWRPTACWKVSWSAAGPERPRPHTLPTPDRRRRGCPSRRRVAHSHAPSLQQAMTRYASVVRDEHGLRELAQELEAATPRALNSRTDFEDVALTTVAGAVAGGGIGPHRIPRLPSPLRLSRHRSGAGLRSLVPCAPWRAADGADRRRADRGSQGDRPRPRGRPAVRTRRHHAGDGSRRRDDDGVDGRPRAGSHCRRGHRAAGARRGARHRRLSGEASR